MTLFRRFLRRLLAVVRFESAEDDLAREIDAHLQLIEDEHVAGGMPRAQARLAARKTFGGVEQAKEHHRDTRSFRWLDDSRIDLKLAARMLVKYPGLTLIGGAGLAVSIAIGTAFFAFFYAYIYATIPAPDGDRIVGLENWSVKTNNEVRQASHDFVTWRNEMKSVQELGAFRTIGRNLRAEGVAAEPIRLAEITAVGLGVPRVQPRLGRALIAADEEPGAPPVLVIGSDVWASRFNSDPSVVGREVRIGNTHHTIVGVMPDGFEFPINHSYWVPLRIEPSLHPRRQGPAIFVFGRLAPGASMEQAQAELTTIASRASAEFPDTHADLRARVMPYAHPVLDIQGITTWQFALMQFLVSLLLLVVALNVGILIYARTATRQGEIAVRAALGASRGRLIGQLFIEALVLCGVAAGVGVLLAQVGLHMGHAIMETEVGRLPYFINAGIPAPAYAYIAALTLAAAVIAGVLPAWQSTGRGMEITLKEFGSRTLRLGATWTTLIVAQVALAVAALPLALAAFWDDISGARTTVTFETRPYVAAFLSSDPEPPPGVDPDLYRRTTAARMSSLQADLIERLEAESMVEDVTQALAMPGDEPSARIEVDGDAPPASGGLRVRVNEVSSDFFAAFGVPLAAGRLLAPADAASAAHPIVVNQTFVRRVLGNGEAIGRRIRYLDSRQDGLALGGAPSDGRITGVDTAPWHEIVGVVGDLYTNPIDPEQVEAGVFHVVGTTRDARASIAIKMRSVDAADFSPRLREMAMSLDPSVRVEVRPFVEMERQQQLALRLMILALSLIIATVLLLSAAGIYALMSFTVSRRRKEIGIRTALGADAPRLLRGIFARSAGQLGAGVAIGATLALAADAMSGGEALGATGRLVFMPAMALMMVVVGLIASIGPARRSFRIPSTDALRAD